MSDQSVLTKLAQLDRLIRKGLSRLFAHYCAGRCLSSVTPSRLIF